MARWYHWWIYRLFMYIWNPLFVKHEAYRDIFITHFLEWILRNGSNEEKERLAKTITKLTSKHRKIGNYGMYNLKRIIELRKNKKKWTHL